MNKESSIYVAGHGGMVGSALVRRLRSLGYQKLILRTHAELDLTDQQAVNAFFMNEQPEYVFLAAARVGGIHANNAFPVQFLGENLKIQSNVVEAAFRNKCRKLLFLGSSCIYPKLAQQPITEDSLLTGRLEPTNEWYAIAKIAGIKLCQAYRTQYGFDAISAMPTNLYGPGDNFDLDNAHVLPALIRKFDEAVSSGADSVAVWGSGKPLREFLYVDDLAEALLFLMDRYSDISHINVGYGTDISIAELAKKIRGIIGFCGSMSYDRSKPDGTPRKLLDSSRILALGWAPRTSLDEGIAKTYEWFQKNRETVRIA